MKKPCHLWIVNPNLMSFDRTEPAIAQGNNTNTRIARWFLS